MTLYFIKKRSDAFFRKRAPQGVPLHLRHRHLYILPTRNGWIFFILLCAMLAGSMNYNNNLGFLLCFLLGSLSFVSIFHTHKNLNGIVLSAVSAAPVFAGDDAAVRIDITSRTRHRYQLQVAFQGSAEPVCISIPKTQTESFTLKQPTRIRGVTRIQPFVIRTVYPLGLFYAWAPIFPEQTFSVYPSPVFCQLPVSATRCTAFESGTNRSGTEASPLMATADTFRELRTYQPGDPMNRIAWKAYSRGQGLMTKTFESQSPPSRLLFDWYAMGDTPVELRLSHLSYLLLEAERNQQQYGLGMPGKTISPAKGNRHLSTCLHALAIHPGASPEVTP